MKHGIILILSITSSFREWFCACGRRQRKRTS